MEKVVVPQFVADWYEEWNSGFLGNKITELEHASGRMEQWIDSLETDDRYGMEIAQEIIAKMHLFQDYEVEEKKYYWRKKKECLLDFEDPLYLRVWSIEGTERYYEFSPIIDTDNYKYQLTESELTEDLGDDIDKLERVEADV